MQTEGLKSLIPAYGMPKVVREEQGLRQVPDLALWALDNSACNCKFRTPACNDCYNRKMLRYSTFKSAWSQGGLDDQNWAKATPESFQGLARVRLNTRGEAFSSLENIDRVAEWVAGNPNTLFWIVTRAWQTGGNGSPENWYKINEPFISAIDQKIRIYKNAKVMASIDDWTSRHVKTLIERGWNTIFFSKENLEHPALFVAGSNVVKCKKTWLKIRNKNNRLVHPKGLCKTCKSGCFSDSRVDVWLKYHQ